MKKTVQKTIALVLLSIVAFLAPGVTAAQAIEIQPLPFPVYVNDKQVTIAQSLLYKGHTYVQLRELSGATNMDIEFVKDEYQMPLPGGRMNPGINITQPTFVYVSDKVYNSDPAYGSVPLTTGVDITTIYERYSLDKNPSLTYGFRHSDETFVVRENGEEKAMDLTLKPYHEYLYVSVDEFREKIQPYLVDMCMQ